MTADLEPSDERGDLLALFHNAGVGMVLVDAATMRFLRVNAMFCAITGRAEAELLRLTIGDVTHPDDWEAGRRRLTQLIEGGFSHHRVEPRIQRPDGTMVSVLINAHPVFDRAGHVTRIAAVVEDISDRKAAEEALQRSESGFRLALEGSNAGVWWYDPVADVTVWDDTTRRHYGHPPDVTPSHQAWLDALHPADRTAVVSQLDQMAATPGDDKWDLEFRSVRPDGSVVWHHALGRAERHPDGSISQMVGIDLDITARKAAEMAAQKASRRLRLLLDTAGATSWFYDPATDLVTIDGPTPPVLGLTSDSTLTMRFILDQIPASLRGQIMEATHGIRHNTSDGFSIDYRLDGPDGRTRWYRSVGKAERDATGALVGLAGIAIDTTELEVRNNQLRELASELVMAEQQVRERIAQTLHDHLQQLLYSAAVTLDRFTTGAGPEADGAHLLAQTRETLGQAIEAARTLSGELFPPELHDHGLPTALRHLGRQLQAQHHIDLDVTIDLAADPPAHDQRIFVYEAARELLFNAAKHARATRHQLTLARTPTGEIQLTVADDGIGFDPDEAPLPRPGQRGLGLARLRQRVPLILGRLEFDSGPGQGTRITLTIPGGG